MCMPRRTYKLIRRGEVYTLTYEFPHERETGISPKERPVLVLSGNKHNLNIYYPTVIVAPISTLKATTKKYDTDLWVNELRITNYELRITPRLFNIGKLNRKQNILLHKYLTH
jgi:mRNA-degrading endonuclease toxin of MazEF toxin-antitoxin module